LSEDRCRPLQKAEKKYGERLRKGHKQRERGTKEKKDIKWGRKEGGNSSFSTLLRKGEYSLCDASSGYNEDRLAKKEVR